MTQGVIFDFDGVIVDSESVHLRAFQRVLSARGWTLTNADYFARYLGYSDLATIEAFARHEGIALSAAKIGEVVDDKTRVFAEMTASGPALFEGAIACIRRLAAEFSIAVASGSFHHEIVEVLDAAGVRPLFRAIVGADDVVETKPAPAPYLEAARLIALAPSACVAIEDSPWGLESAQHAGARTIGITNTYPRARLTNADVVVDSLNEVTAAVVRALLNRRA